MNFNLRELQYILRVSEIRNITRAAEELHISQPALSRYIRDVETELGAKIFDRSTNPLSLTFAGECYIASAKRILLEHENLMREIRDITHHMTGRLRIGTSRDRASYMMPKLLPAFCEKYPGISVEVFTESGKKLREALREGKIDILILPDTWPKSEYNFISRLIYREKLVLAAKAGTITAATPETMSSMKFFMLFREHAIRSFCDRYFREHDIKPEVIMEFPSNITCYRMAATGMGVTIIPELTAKMTDSGNDTELFTLGETWEVRAFFRKGEYIGEPEQELITMAKKIFS